MIKNLLFFRQTKFNPTVNILGILLMLLIIVTKSNSQDLTYWPCDTDCQGAQDLYIDEVYLGDIDGNELPQDFTCIFEEDTTAYLWAVFGGSTSTNRYSLYVYYELLFDGVPEDTVEVIFPDGDPIAVGDSLLLDTISWECGAEVSLIHYYLGWYTNQTSTTDCGSRCAYPGDTLIVQAPLFARFLWETYCEPGEPVSWIKAWSTTSGGDGNYTNDWDYTDGGKFESEIEDTIWVSYPGGSAGNSYDLKLTVTDGNSVSDDTTRIVTLGTCCFLDVSCPPDLTGESAVECDEIPTLALPGDTAANAGFIIDGSCGTPLVYSSDEDTINKICPNSYTLVRTYIVFDDLDEDGIWDDGKEEISDPCTQYIQVVDTTPPTFTAPDDITIYADASCSFDSTTTATGDVTNEADNCGVGEATYSDAVNDSDPCNIIITRTWSLVVTRLMTKTS